MNGKVEYSFVRDNLLHAYGIIGREKRRKHTVMIMPLERPYAEITRLVEQLNVRQLPVEQLSAYLLREGYI